MINIAGIASLAGLAVALGCALAALGAGLGYRFGWWHYGTGIAMLGYPLVLKAPRDKVFAAAQGTLASMGLEQVAADAAQGRIEATATSLLFGFKDDVVVRVADDPNGTKVDVRSQSRVGGNDFGMNAKRIRAFQG
jgi:hypothetical protein